MLDRVSGWFSLCLSHIKNLSAYFFSISALCTALWSMLAIDSSSIDAEVTAVSVNNNVLVELISYVVPETAATVYYRLDGKEVLHHHYNRIPDGKKVQVLSLPLETHSEVRVDVVIRLEGIRTLFTDNEVKYTQYVVVGE